VKPLHQQLIEIAEEIARQSRLQAAIAECAQHFAETRDIHEIMRNAVPVIRENIGLDRVGIFLYDDDANVWRGEFGTDQQGRLRDERNITIPEDPRHPILRAAAGEGDEFFIADFESEFPDDAFMHGVKNLFFVAFRARGRLLGGISVDNLLSGRSVDEDTRRDLRGFARYIALALENFLLTRDLEAKNEALRKTEAKYQDLFDNAPDMYFVVNAAGTVLSVNREGARQLGYEVEELVGQPVGKVIFPPDEPAAVEQIREIMARPDEVHRLAFRKVRKDGSIIHVAERVSVLDSDEGSGPHIRILCRDITSRIEAEQRELGLRERLARSERLESLAILAGGVAHDLNNILGPLVGYPDLVMEQLEEGTETYEDLLAMKASTRRAVEIVRDLLVLARRSSVELVPLSLSKIVGAYLDSPEWRQVAALHPEVRLVTRLGEGLPLVAGSATHLTKAAMNLVINGVEAMPREGELTVETSARTLSAALDGYETVPAGDYVVLDVTDTATGISAADQERIFEPFYTRKKLQRSGTGLGLAIVHGVMRDHGGYIDLQSSDEGSVFSLFFPACDATVRDAGAGAVATATGGGERVLVVDDVSEQRDLAVRFLLKLGYSVVTASTGREAVTLVSGEMSSGDAAAPKPFDLVILDMIMEEDFDGLDTYRELLRLIPGLPCIIASGYSETDRVREVLALGAGRYLPKPYTLQNLADAVRCELDRRADTG